MQRMINTTYWNEILLNQVITSGTVVFHSLLDNGNYNISTINFFFKTTKYIFLGSNRLTESKCFVFSRYCNYISNYRFVITNQMSKKLLLLKHIWLICHCKWTFFSTLFFVMFVCFNFRVVDSKCNLMSINFCAVKFCNIFVCTLTIKTLSTKIDEFFVRWRKYLPTND